MTRKSKFAYAAVLFLGLVATSKLSAQPTLPTSCYRADGYIDLQTCMPESFWNIPLPELANGYYGVFGFFIPRLPADRMDVFAPGTHLLGNASRYSVGQMQLAFNQRITQWQLDPSGYLGGIALDSCGYMQHVVWVSIASGQPVGPFLVVDCRSLIHKYEIACVFGTVAEMMYEPFDIQETGLVANVAVFIAPPGDLRPPAAGLVDSQPVQYPETWLREANMSC